MVGRGSVRRRTAVGVSPSGGRGPGAEDGLGARFHFVCGLGDLRRGPRDLGASAPVTPRGTRWGRTRGARRPATSSGPRLTVMVAGRREFPAAGQFRPVGLVCSWWSCPVGPPSWLVLLIRTSPEAAGGCSVQLPHCSGPGALLTVADPERPGAVAPVETHRSSCIRSGTLFSGGGDR